MILATVPTLYNWESSGAVLAGMISEVQTRRTVPPLETAALSAAADASSQASKLMGRDGKQTVPCRATTGSVSCSAVSIYADLRYPFGTHYKYTYIVLYHISFVISIDFRKKIPPKRNFCVF